MKRSCPPSVGVTSLLPFALLVLGLGAACAGAPAAAPPTEAPPTAAAPPAPPTTSAPPATSTEPTFAMVGVVGASSAAPEDPNFVVRGPLPPIVIKRILAFYEKRLEGCAAAGGLKRLVLDFTIDLTGRVDSASLSGVTAADVKSCAANVLQGARFPEPEGAVSVHYELPPE